MLADQTSNYMLTHMSTPCPNVGLADTEAEKADTEAEKADTENDLKRGGVGPGYCRGSGVCISN